MPFFQRTLDFFWNLRQSTQPGTFEATLDAAEYPEEFSETYVEDLGMYSHDSFACRGACLSWTSAVAFLL